MSDPAQTGPAPNIDEGWGRVDLTQIMDSDRPIDYVEQNTPLANGQILESKLLIAGRAEDARNPTTSKLTLPTNAPGILKAEICTAVWNNNCKW